MSSKTAPRRQPEPASAARTRRDAATGRTRRRTGWVMRAVLVAIVLLAGYVVVTGVQVWWSTTRDAARSADAIVVLGAAQYDGRPSAALQGRLDHALQLYEAGYAPLVVVTGGRQAGDRYTEAAASANYLEGRGMPGDVIERETTGGTSYASIAATARFLADEGLDRVLLVSDPFHNHRIRAIAREVGLDAHVSATTASPFSGVNELRQLARETVAVSLGRVIGYRRLDQLGLRLRQLGAEELEEEAGDLPGDDARGERQEPTGEAS
ncbi:YdcF family protein [Egibacter rhizosphaerae]|uniref:YdcF family protein n=1 Tax=Egibacter rhizosphaerae TaxID=1670831 RepID=UPI00197ACAC2|nr:YdcF family protein [Egibacter rhizosphaerae]